MSRSLLCDWRGVPDLNKSADFYSIASTHQTRPVTGNPAGKILVGVSSTVYFTPSGQPVDKPYNRDLWDMANRYDAWLEQLDPEPNGYYGRLFNITTRGVLSTWKGLLFKHYGWAEGFHIDWFTAWSWAFPEMERLDAAWDNALVTLANALRREGKLVIGQQFHLTNPVLACNGAWLEDYPTAFSYTMAMHAEEKRRMEEFTSRVDARESLWVAELRYPEKFTSAYKDAMRAWAEYNGMILSIGRDATAGQTL